MGSPFGIERRDPVSPVLMLGSILSRAWADRQSGHVEVRDRGRVYSVRLVDGAIADVIVGDAPEHLEDIGNKDIQERAERLFVLPRPHVLFEPVRAPSKRGGGVDPHSVIVSGVVRRQDLFDPLTLVERIPMSALSLDSTKLRLLGRLPFSRSEREFLERLRVPTPVTMALWKRGLEPRHAGAMLVALNLLGLWRGWGPGDLPRPGAATRIARQTMEKRPDNEILGVDPDAPMRDVDRAFRRLSLELHPDRLIGLPPEEAARARAAYANASAAHARMRRSRRSRPVQGDTVRHAGKNAIQSRSEPWYAHAAEALQASRSGQCGRARAFALKAMALSPPDEIKSLLKQILRNAA